MGKSIRRERVSTVQRPRGVEEPEEALSENIPVNKDRGEDLSTTELTKLCKG